MFKKIGKKNLVFLLSVSLILSISRENVLAKFTNCDPNDFATNYVRNYKRGQVLSRELSDTQKLDPIERAQCQQAEAIKLLETNLGNKIGYKVALTNKKAQNQMGVNSPLVGVLLEKMLLPDGSIIPINSGARLIYEIDFLVKIKSEDINDAKTITDVARNIEAIYPFIEVPDLMLSPDVSLTPEILTAINVGAKWGVMGKPIPARSDREFLQALANMRVTMYDESGKLLTEARGKDILEHPFNSVLFLIKELDRRGEKLRSQDVVSLGTFGRFHAAKSGKSAIAVYQGIAPQPATVLVKFK